MCNIEEWYEVREFSSIMVHRRPLRSAHFAAYDDAVRYVKAEKLRDYMITKHTAEVVMTPSREGK